MFESIVFISENQITGKVPRDFENARTEFGWSIALDADWLPIGQQPNKEYDLGIVIIPKSNPNINIELYRNFCVNLAIMQEGPHWYYQDYTIEQQFDFINNLRAVDWVYCHNKDDKLYYQGIGCEDVRIMRTLMIPEGIQPVGYSTEKKGILIGGNFVSWYGGMDGYLTSLNVDDDRYIVSMGRKNQQENMIPDLNILPYMNWRDWINHIGRYKVSIHLMRNQLAGTFSMNSSFHGTPCIGYKKQDTQQILHPQTTVDVGNVKEAVRIMKKLYEDDNFYKECSEQTSELFRKHYSEEAWLEHWNKENK